MIVQDNAIVQYYGQWPQSLTCAVVGLCDSPSQILSQVVARLNGDGLIVLQSSLPGVVTAFGPSFNVNLTIQNNRGLAFGSEFDLVSIIRHEVFVVTGKFPFSDSVPSVQNPGTPRVPTGQPGAPTGAPGGDGSYPDNCSFLDYIAGNCSNSPWDAVSQLGSNTSLIIVGGAIGLIAAVLLISKGKG